MDISHPRRILAVSHPDSGLLDLVKGITGTAPTLATDSVAGTTHNWTIKTNYYKASVPIWLDEISEPHVWSSQFLAPEAREVLTVLGAFVVCFRKPIHEAALTEVKTLLEHVSEVVKEGCGYSWDGVCLAVAMPQSTTPSLEKSFDEWEDLCQEFGFEFIDFESKGRNEYAEPMGIERLKEALEANDWDGRDEFNGGMEPEDFDENRGETEDGIDFGIDSSEMEAEMSGMKQAIYGGGSEGDGDHVGDDEDNKEVEKLQAMLLKMQAARDMGADLPEAERKRFAAKAVSEIMKTL